MITNLDHLNIVVSDLECALRFYVQGLGLKETHRAELAGEWIEAVVGLKGVKATVAYLETPNGTTRLELLQYHSPIGQQTALNSQPNTIGLRHLAFHVDDMDLATERLREIGAEITGGPIVVPTGAVQHSRGRKTLCYFRDPDGVILELAEYRRD